MLTFVGTLFLQFVPTLKRSKKKQNFLRHKKFKSNVLKGCERETLLFLYTVAAGCSKEKSVTPIHNRNGTV